MPEWGSEVRPVLDAAFRAMQRDSAGGAAGLFEANGPSVNEFLERDADDDRTAAVIRELERTEYLEADWALGSAMPMSVRFTEKGYQEVGGWPRHPGDETFARLIEVLNSRIDAAPTPEERTRLERLRDAVAGVGRDVLTDVLSKVATEGL